MTVGQTLTNGRWVMTELTDKISTHSRSPGLYEAQFFHLAMGCIWERQLCLTQFVGKQWQCSKSSSYIWISFYSVLILTALNYTSHESISI